MILFLVVLLRTRDGMKNRGGKGEGVRGRRERSVESMISHRASVHVLFAVGLVW